MSRKMRDEEEPWDMRVMHFICMITDRQMVSYVTVGSVCNSMENCVLCLQDNQSDKRTDCISSARVTKIRKQVYLVFSFSINLIHPLAVMLL